MAKIPIDTDNKVCYRHDIDLESEFCKNCGRSLPDIVDNQLKCDPPKNLTAISHRRYKQRRAKLRHTD